LRKFCLKSLEKVGRRNHSKRRRKIQKCPGCASMRLGCAKQWEKSLYPTHTRDTHDPRRMAHTTVEKTFKWCFFPCGFGEQAHFFNKNSIENLTINTRNFIHKFSFRTWRFKMKTNIKSINEGVSPQPLFLEYFFVLFLWFVFSYHEQLNTYW